MISDPALVRCGDIPFAIRLCRVSVNMKQSEAAGHAGWTQGQWSQYERGDREPTLHTLERIFEALGFEIQISIRRKE